jgi:hypothetical protein
MFKKIFIVSFIVFGTIFPYLNLDHTFAQISGNEASNQLSGTPTNVSGNINSDTTWTVENSPYTLTGDVQIAYGSSLTIEPGVVINGQGYNLSVFGNLNATGLPDSKINFQNINILGGRSQSNSEFYQITIQHSNIDSSRILPTGYNSSNDGSLILRDSTITNLTFMLDLEYPSSNSYIERNIFKDSYGIITRTQNSAKVFIKNNVFYRQKDYAIMNLYTNSTSETVVQYNSFLSIDRTALRLGSNSSTAKMTATDNFFNTTDPTIINSMIYDKNDDLALSSFITYQPFLSVQHSDTLEAGIVVVNGTKPVQGAVNVPINDPIDVSFNNNISKGLNFSSITLKDNQNKVIPMTTNVVDNKLHLTPSTNLSFNTQYTVTIPAGALKNLSGNDIDAHTLSFTTQFEKGIAVSGIIKNDTTWTVKNSPYILTGDVQVAYGSTLTIEPGVIVRGQSKNLVIFGNLNAIGLADSNINLQNINILGGRSQSNSEFYSITIQHSNIDSSRILPTGYNSSNDGSLILKDSTITNLTFMLDLEYPSSNSYIERNIFKDSYGIITRTQNSTKVFIKNNVFYRQKNYAIMNQYTNGTSETVVQYNSFLSADRVAIRLGSNSSTSKMTATDNFFNTTDPAIINSMIYDKNDDLALASVISYQPFLTKLHSDTPDAGIVIVNETKPLHGAANVKVNAPIDVLYSNNISKGLKYSSITLKDSQNHVIPITANVVDNKLSLAPGTNLNFNTQYTVTIPAGALKDSSGNDIDDYTFSFTTQLEKGIAISGIIKSDTTWTVENSPYILTGDVQLAYGSTLTIEPGVTVKGQDKNLVVFGNLNAIGLPDSKINFQNNNILGGRSQSNSEFYQITIQHSNIDSSEILPTGYNSSNDGSLILRDSTITNLTFMLDLEYPSSDSYIERNIFKDSYGIISRTQNSTKVFIKNNVFYQQKNYAIMNLYTDDSSETVVQHNSFLSTDRVALRLGNNSSSAKMTATDNFFNTTDPANIDSMIYDKNDDLALTSTINYLPYVNYPDGYTPIADVFYLLKTEPYNLQKNVSINSTINMVFSKDFVEGTEYNNIKLIDSANNIVPITIQKNGSSLSIIPNNPLQHNSNYEVILPSDALQGEGQNGNSEYSFNFNTAKEVEAPTNLTATLNNGAVNLKWESTSNDVVGFNIYRSIDSSDFTKINNTLVNDTTTYIDANTNFGESFYQVTAIDQYGNESEPSLYYKISIPAPVNGWTEDSSKSIIHDGSWRPFSNSYFSDGSIIYTGQKGASAEVNFLGVGIRLYALTSPYYGLTDVYIDNEFIQEVNLYSDKTKYKQLVFEYNNLEKGIHTIKFINKGAIGNPLGKGSNFNIDAFDIIEDKDTIPPEPPKSLKGTISYNNVNLSWSPNLETDIKGYNIYRSSDGVNYSKLNLSVLDIPKFDDNTVENGKEYYYQITAVDNFDNESNKSLPYVATLPKPVINWTEDSSSIIMSTGKWRSFSNSSFSEGTILYTGQKGATIELAFTGTGIRLYSLTSPYYGLAEIYIDNEKVQEINQFSAKTKYKQLVFEHLNLNEGDHIIKVINKGVMGSSLGRGININVDAFDVLN